MLIKLLQLHLPESFSLNDLSGLFLKKSPKKKKKVVQFRIPKIEKWHFHVNFSILISK